MKAAFDLARRAAATASGRRPPFILCYHGVGQPAGPDEHGLFVSSAQFAEHLDVITRRGYTMLTVSELWRRIVSDDANGYGAITFDDALVKVGEEALPLLRARGMPSTVYVATGLLGQRHPHMPSEWIMDAAQVAEIARDGVEIGSHSVDHPRLPELSYDQALKQLIRSRRELEELTGRQVTTAAYPFGVYGPETVRAMREAGYETACACEGAGPWEQLTLPREAVFPSITPLRLYLKMAGLYGPLHRVVRVAIPTRTVPTLVAASACI